jgi:clan AA aspartic protease (TIGR02281 family)
VNDPSVVSVVFSLGEGMNGDMIPKDRRVGRMIIAQCKEGILKLKIKAKDGSEKSLPDINTNELKQYSIRVNVTGAKGFQKAFRINNYDKFEDDKGPVLDMFGGKLPLSSGDFSITTETKSAPKPSGLKGKVGYRFKDDWIQVPLTLPNGKTYQFVFDLAATSTVISQSILPIGVGIRKIEMVEYQANEKTAKEASMQGATGSVSGDMFSGKAILKECKLGDIKIDEIDAIVLKTFPSKLEKMGISGILGTDVLRRTSSITIKKIMNEESGVVEFGNILPSEKESASYPFTIAGGLFFVEGKVGNIPVQFVIDTGARTTVLSSSFAKEYGLTFKTISDKEITGIDGQPVKAQVVFVPEFWLGNSKFNNTQMTMTDVAALQSFGLQKGSALLGMDFFTNFSEVTFDMADQKMILIN